MKKLHVPALKEALVRALGLRGDVRLDLDGTIVPVMIAGTTLETGLATQVRVVNDLEDPAGVEFKQPVRISAPELDVKVTNTDPIEVIIDDADPVRVELAEALHVQVYEDKSPFFRYRVFGLGEMKTSEDHYVAIGRWDDDDSDSHSFVYERIVIRSTDNDEDWDNWEFWTVTDNTSVAAGYSRDRFRTRFGDLASGDYNPCLRHKGDFTTPGAFGGSVGKIRDIGGTFEEIDHPSDSIGQLDLGGLGMSCGYHSTNVWGIGMKRARRNTPTIDLMIAGYWLPK